MRILTFDIEEWFHILDNKSTKTQSEWLQYESRIFYNMEKIYGLLERNKTKATFFILGWIAEKYPEIIRTIDQLGYEIGSHSHMHQLMYGQKRSEIETDLRKSLDTIENIIGKKIRIFRAPGFSITKENLWVFEILHKYGINTDCSVFPAERAHGGIPELKIEKPFLISYDGINLREFPINVGNCLGYNFIFSGGGYFRLTPYSMIKHLSYKSDYIMSYFHPRDFDQYQPMIKDLPLFRKFKSYYGLSKSYSKLERWISENEFIDCRTASLNISWDKVPKVNIKESLM